MALTIIGIFDDASEAQQAVEALVSNGFSRSSIDLSAGRYNETTTGSTTTGSMTTGEVFPDRHVNTSGTRTEEFVDDAKDVGSGIGGFFSSLFGGDDDDTSRRYSTVADRGSVVTVHAQTQDEAERAADILDDNGAVDVNERAAAYGYANTTGFNDVPQARTAVDGDQTINVIEENLQVGKQTVETGGVRVRSRIVERPVEEHLRLRTERVIVQRNPVNRPVSTTDLDAFTEGDITLTERAERAVVAKEAHVVEEVTIGKQVEEHDEVIRDTVRKTDVEIEQINPTTTTTNTTRTTDGDDVTYAAR